MHKRIDPEPIVAVFVLLMIMALMVATIMCNTADARCKPEYIGHVIQIGTTCSR